jgi:hypothetical protein
MAKWPALTIQSGVVKQKTTTDFLSVGAGIAITGLSTTARDLLTPTAGDLIFNTTNNELEWYSGGTWRTPLYGTALPLSYLDGTIDGVRPISRMYLTNGSGDTIPVGRICYISADRAVSQSKADSINTAKATFISLDEIEDAEDGNFARNGTVPIPPSQQYGNTWVAGDQIYVSDATAGYLTNIAPTTSNHFIVVIGWVITIIDGTAYLDMSDGIVCMQIP